MAPLRFYHGERPPYPYRPNWLDCFAEPALARRIYTTAFPLIDIAAIPDGEIKTHRRIALPELVLRHIHTRDMLELARDIGILIESGKPPLAQQRALILYILKTGGHPIIGPLLMRQPNL